MTYDFSRRDFIGGALAFSGLAGCITGFTGSGKRWYKGNLHMHTFWSDGKAFPEEAVLWYKTRGYDFIGLSDHNVYQSDPDRWATCDGPDGKRGKVGAEYAEKYLKAFPGTPTRKDKDGRMLIRLKTFDELAQAYNEPGGFLLIPDVEATRKTTLGNGRVHQRRHAVARENAADKVTAISSELFPTSSHATTLCLHTVTSSSSQYRKPKSQSGILLPKPISTSSFTA